MSAAVDHRSGVKGKAEPPSLHRALAGVLVGTAVGDALGLPMKGMDRHRQQRLFPSPFRHRLIGRCGMVSDDTEHTLMVAHALLQHARNADAFGGALAWELRWWLLSLPAGVGFATLRPILKLWMGISPERSGVRSPGNGPSMRKAVLGVFFSEDAEQRWRFIHTATRVTHTDPRAEIAAQAVGETTAWAALGSGSTVRLLAVLEELSNTPEWQSILLQVRSALDQQLPVVDFAEWLGLGRGVSG